MAQRRKSQCKPIRYLRGLGSGQSGIAPDDGFLAQHAQILDQLGKFYWRCWPFVTEFTCKGHQCQDGVVCKSSASPRSDDQRAGFLWFRHGQIGPGGDKLTRLGAADLLTTIRTPPSGGLRMVADFAPTRTKATTWAIGQPEKGIDQLRPLLNVPFVYRCICSVRTPLLGARGGPPTPPCRSPGAQVVP
jgi:hypothetical protein